jgi:hypothetical protein
VVEVSTIGELAAVGELAGVEPKSLMRGKETTRSGGWTEGPRVVLDRGCLFWFLCFWPWA